MPKTTVASFICEVHEPMTFDWNFHQLFQITSFLDKQRTELHLILRRVVLHTF